MSNFDPQSFEQELRKLHPAKPPPELARRISPAAPFAQQRRQSRFGLQGLSSWWGGLGWMTSAAVTVIILLALVYRPQPRAPLRNPARLPLNPTGASLKADNVEINQQLVTSFDAVTQLPDGEPVRLRCREWLDAVVLRDSARGVIIERHAPRLEVVPVRFETY